MATIPDGANRVVFQTAKPVAGRDRLPYAPPRLVRYGSFRDLTRGGGLTGPDLCFPYEGNRAGNC